jgi:excisionase family DNA binding protein
MTVKKRFLKASEAAKYLGVSESTVVRWRLAGDGPYFFRFPGGAIRYAVDDLEAWMQSMKVGTRSEGRDQLPAKAAPKGGSGR